MIVHINIAPEYVIIIDGKRYPFECPYPHPWPLDKHGEPMGAKCKAGHPREWEGVPFWKHRFWKAAWWWAKQGKRVENGVAIWEPVMVRKPILQHVNKRNAIIIGYEDELIEEPMWQ